MLSSYLLRNIMTVHDAHLLPRWSRILFRYVRRYTLAPVRCCCCHSSIYPLCARLVLCIGQHLIHRPLASIQGSTPVDRVVSSSDKSATPSILYSRNITIYHPILHPLSHASQHHCAHTHLRTRCEYRECNMYLFACIIVLLQRVWSPGYVYNNACHENRDEECRQISMTGKRRHHLHCDLLLSARPLIYPCLDRP